MQNHKLYSIWDKVPVTYYQSGVKNNLFQWLWHSTKINLAKKNYPHIKFQVASAEKLPFKNNSFDLILCFETIEHVENPQKTLNEIKKVLKKDGTAVLTMDSGNMLFRIVWWFWEKTKGKVWQNAHLHPFHHSQLENLITEAGFKIRKKKFSFFGMEVTFVLQIG